MYNERQGAPLLEAGTIIDRYVVESELGEGGLAQVYKVRHQKLGTKHALKVLMIRRTEAMERLLREGRAQASLDHPNVVAVTDVIEVDGAPGLLMDLVEGPVLSEWIQNTKPDFATAEAMFRGIVAGVAAAHEQGLIHRDLKPTNVLLEPVEGGFIPRVTDFGLVKAAGVDDSLNDSNSTRTGAALGTPTYMAPEQVYDARSVDFRADIYSLGCILYLLVCHQPAFSGTSTLHILNRVVSGDYTRANRVAKHLPDRIAQAIDGAMRTDVEDRIESCEQLLRVLDGKEQAPGQPERNTWIVPAAIVAVALGLVGGVVALAAMVSPTVTPSVLADDNAVWEVSAVSGAALPAQSIPAPEDLPSPAKVPLDPTAKAIPTKGPHQRKCDTRRQRILGYALLPPTVNPEAGTIWTVPKALSVRKQYPNKANKFAIGTREVCILEAGDRVTIEQTAIVVRAAGTWLPIIGKAVTLRPEE